MPDQAPNIDIKRGEGSRLIYDKERRTIVAAPKNEESMTYLVKRPVAFRVPRVVDDRLSDTEWQLFGDEKAAHDEAEAKSCDYQGLFVRDGTAIVAEWEPIDGAPQSKDYTFAVCSTETGQGPFLVRGDILWRARQDDTPAHLSMRHLTHWMPMPLMPKRA